ncbi:unnamed protein product [Phyllotreta striolata]|uniref:Odorant receptor n=1 Tax=Phyllotreta striolata TaxID=444603 RepID=A0A9N9TUP5_PHYSR|nr:unnamed protein product [Phyllotreta striolata]
MTNQKLLRKSFWHIELLLKLNGLLPGERYQILYSFYAYGLLFVFKILFPILGYTFIYKADPSERMVLIGNSFVYIEVLVLVFKHWPFITDPDLTKRLMNQWNENIFNTEVEIDKHIIEESMRQRKIKHNVYFYTALSAPIMMLINVILSDHSDLKLPIWTPVDVLNSTSWYVWTNAFVFSAYLHGVLGHFSVDMLIVSYMLYCVAQLKLIKYKLENMEQYLDTDLTTPDQIGLDDLVQKKIYAQITQCVKHYDAVFRAQQSEMPFSEVNGTNTT